MFFLQLEDVDFMTAFGFADEGMEAIHPSSSSEHATAAAAAAAAAASASSPALIPPSTLDPHPFVQPSSTALAGGCLEDDAAKLIVQHEIFVKATVSPA
jgi:hypothetical protein